jgi:small subunit ribosomal protein S6
MRHYEIVLMIHPDQSEQVPSMLDRYRHSVESQQGIVHRSESCGRRHLAYQIKRVHKAHYAVLNIECEQAVLKELDQAFRFNDAIMRYLIVTQEKAITGPSLLVKEEESSAELTASNLRKEKTSSGEIKIEGSTDAVGSVQTDSVEKEG